MKNYLLTLATISTIVTATNVASTHKSNSSEINISDINYNLGDEIAPLKTNVTNNIGQVFKLVDNWKQFASDWQTFVKNYQHVSFENSQDTHMTANAIGYKPYQSYGQPALTINNSEQAMDFDTTKIVDQQPAFDSSGFNYWDVAKNSLWNIYFLSSNSYSRWFPHLYEISFHSWFAVWHDNENIYGELVTNYQIDTHDWILPVHFNTVLNLTNFKITQ